MTKRIKNAPTALACNYMILLYFYDETFIPQALAGEALIAIESFPLRRLR